MIAEKGWELFIKVEENGGFTEALRKGIIQSALKASAEKRIADISKRKEILLGTNQYPGFNEKITTKSRKSVKKPEAPAKGDVSIEPIRVFRGAEHIESIRFAADEAAGRPSVFMLTIGNPAMRLARSQFSCNFFACGGYRVIDNTGFKTAEEGAEAALASGAAIIVICSSDDEYAIYAPAINQLVNGKAILVIAGNPSCTDELKAKGINYFISVRSDLAETLTMFHRLTGLIK
jgi:methylmalonyl-CoA mutase